MSNECLPIEACLSWDSTLYDGTGGYHLRFHRGLFSGVYLICVTEITQDKHKNKFLEIRYEPKEDPLFVIPGNRYILEERLVYILNRSKLSEDHSESTCNKSDNYTQTTG